MVCRGAAIGIPDAGILIVATQTILQQGETKMRSNPVFFCRQIKHTPLKRPRNDEAVRRKATEAVGGDFAAVGKKKHDGCRGDGDGELRRG